MCRVAVDTPVAAFAERLQHVCELSAIAPLVFEVLRSTAAITTCRLALHAPDGRPLLTLDDESRDDVERLAFLDGDWTLDALLRDAMATQTAAFTAAACVLPLVEPPGVVGSLRLTLATEVTREQERRLHAIVAVVVARLAQLGITTSALATDDVLTKRQRDAAMLAQRGMTTSQIAAALDISHNTVKKHLQNAFDRLAVGNRMQLARALQVEVVREIPFGVTRAGAITCTRRPYRASTERAAIDPAAAERATLDEPAQVPSAEGALATVPAASRR